MSESYSAKKKRRRNLAEGDMILVQYARWRHRRGLSAAYKKSEMAAKPREEGLSDIRRGGKVEREQKTN